MLPRLRPTLPDRLENRRGSGEGPQTGYEPILLFTVREVCTRRGITRTLTLEQSAPALADVKTPRSSEDIPRRDKPRLPTIS